MGFGDDLLRAGWAQQQKKRVDFGYWSEVWEGNPWVLRPGADQADLRISVGEWEKVHGYGEGRTPDRYFYRKSFRPARAKFYLTDAELDAAHELIPRTPFVLVEPHIKGLVGADNRDWGWGNWEALAGRCPDLFVQCGAPGVRRLSGIRSIETPTFRHACAVLALSQGIVTTNGGLHHAAAALHRPAVVIWGGYNDPEMLGYADHINLYEANPQCEGRRQSDPACRACMDRITVDRVYSAVVRMCDASS